MSPLQVLPKCLHRFLLNGVVGLRPLAAGDRLDGSERVKPHPLLHGAGVRLAAAVLLCGRHGDRAAAVLLRSRIPRLAEDGQYQGMGEPLGQRVDRQPGPTAEADPKRHQAVRDDQRPPGVCRARS